MVCNCTSCGSELKFNVKTATQQARVKCPRCQHSFSVIVPKPQPSVGPLDQLTPVDLAGAQSLGPRGGRAPVNQPSPYQPAPYQPISPQGPPYQSPYGASSAYTPLDAHNAPSSYRDIHSAHNLSTPHTNNSPVLKLLLFFIGGFLLLVFVGIVVAGLSYFSAEVKQVGSLTKDSVGFDSHDAVDKDLEKLRTEIESTGSAIQEGQRQQRAEELKNRYQPQFDALLVRARKLAAQPRSLEQYIESVQRNAGVIQQLNQKTAQGQTNNIFWDFNTSADPSDKWQAMIRSFIHSTSAIRQEMEGRIEYPSPLTYQGNFVAWSDEDRRVLAATWLQGKLYRGLLIELVALESQSSPAPESRLRQIFENFDKIADEGLQLSNIPSTQGKVVIDAPRNAPYQFQTNCAVGAIDELKNSLEMGTHPSRSDLLAAIRVAEALSDHLENIQFNKKEGITKFASVSAWDALPGLRREIVANEQKVAAKQANERLTNEDRERRQRELHEQQIERLRKQQETARLAIEEHRKRLEDRANARNNMRPGGAGGLGPGFGAPGFGDGQVSGLVPGGPGGSIGIGPGGINNDSQAPPSPNPDRFGPPGFGSGIMGPGNMGPGPGGLGGRDGFGPPQMPGFPGRGGMGMGGFAKPEMTASGVTLKITEVDDGSFKKIEGDFAKFNNRTWSRSNSNATLQIMSYDKPLADIEKDFPSLKIDSIDEKTRTITAKPR